MAFAPMAIGAANTAGYVVDRTDSTGLFDINEPDEGVEAFARGTRKEGDENRRRELSTLEHPVKEAVVLNPHAQQVDLEAGVVPSSTMALQVPVKV